MYDTQNNAILITMGTILFGVIIRPCLGGLGNTYVTLSADKDGSRPRESSFQTVVFQSK